MIVPPSALLDGLLSVWPYLLGGAGLALAVGFAVPVKKKQHEESSPPSTKTIVREEVQNDVKIVTKIKKEKVEVPYDFVLKLIADYEKIKQDAQKNVLTQWALLEAKMEEEREKRLRELTNPDLAYKDLVKVKRTDDKRKEEEGGEEEEVDVDTSELYQA
jgi:hypothetical protein